MRERLILVVKRASKKITTLAAVTVMAFSGLAAAGPMFSGSALAASVCTNTVGSSPTTFVQHIANDPDSAVPGGNWALDTFTRTIQVWEDTGHECALATDSGTFDTTSAPNKISPQNGVPLPQNITGTMNGSTFGEITGGTFDQLGTSLNTSIDCSGADTATCASGLTGYWVQALFGNSASYDYGNNWGWTYTATNDSTWVNSASGNIGDIYPVYNATSGIGYSDIQSAVTAATTSNNIEVVAGTYNENLVINKALDLEGPNSGTAAINGGDGFAITLESPNVTINGFTIKANSDGEGIYNIDASTPGHDISGTVITNNIFSGSSRAIALESNATGTVKVNDNQFDSYDKDLAVADNSFGNFQVMGNTFNEPGSNDTSVQIGPDGTGIISSFEFENNDVTGNVNIGADVNGATISGNTFNYGSVSGGSVEFQAALHNSSVVSNNHFYGNSDYACLQLFGSQYGLPHPSDGVTVSGNDFHDCGNASSPYYNYGFQLSQDVSNVTFSGNTIDNAYDGINTRFFSGSAWTIGSGISISGNQITNSRHLAVNNTVSGTLNAAQNWFGSASNPTSLVSSNVTVIPWCAQAACSSYLSDQNLSLTPSGGTATSSSTGSTTVNGSGTVGTVTATIPASTTITSSNSSWDGVIAAPAAANYTVPGSNTTSLAISVGSDDGSSLSFNQPVELVLAGQAGKSVGFVKNGVFTAITQVCGGTPTIGDLNALDPVGACYIANDGSGNLIVWTDHFTTFATYTPIPASGSSSSSGTTKSSASSGTGVVQGESTTNGQTSSTNTEVPATASLAQPKIAAKEAAGGGLRWYWIVLIAIFVLGLAVATIYRYAEGTDKA